MKSRQRVTALSILIGTLGLCACQSATPPNSQGNEQANMAAELAILKEKQKKYDAVVEEWQSMREGLQRLVVVEEELGLLIGQLDQMSSQSPTPHQEPQTEQVSTIAPIASNQNLAETTATSTQSKFQNENEMQPKFALQLTAVTSPARLNGLWRELSTKYPQLLADLPANYQKIKVKSTDYFRLKAGAFVTEQHATEHCNSLKAVGIGCMVSDYNNAPLTDLSN
ncbi:SPOR domain-containing protein [Bowmanella sp. Y26]|uniref:SPOR domain-containing protein n=1 Tax=Bowmanella yangjiangensis TaxID=2811230 RepID=UPI001BDCE43E|nr:SPOR domain-containing protein [Bowmanella yangjiangensis]MBT1065220.1 SPOR domain-containing protein [Bowmanella yangjiangensis]